MDVGFSKLGRKRFKKGEGHCIVSKSHAGNGADLGVWVCQQRQIKRKEKLDPYRKRFSMLLTLNGSYLRTSRSHLGCSYSRMFTAVSRNRRSLRQKETRVVLSVNFQHLYFFVAGENSLGVLHARYALGHYLSSCSKSQPNLFCSAATPHWGLPIGVGCQQACVRQYSASGRVSVCEFDAKDGS
jgi:hypothetical protein